MVKLRQKDLVFGNIRQPLDRVIGALKQPYSPLKFCNIILDQHC